MTFTFEHLFATPGEGPLFEFCMLLAIVALFSAWWVSYEGDTRRRVGLAVCALVLVLSSAGAIIQYSGVVTFDAAAERSHHQGETGK